MTSKEAIDDALARLAHHGSRSKRWKDMERMEWERHPAILEASDEELDAAVSAIVSRSERYSLDALLGKLGKKRVVKPPGEGCPTCIGGMVEIAVWRGEGVTAFNPKVVAIKCRCNGGGLIKDACAALREQDRTITELYVAVEPIDGRPHHRSLNERQTGEEYRKMLREGGHILPGSMPDMYPDQFKVVTKPAPKRVNFNLTE